MQAGLAKSQFPYRTMLGVAGMHLSQWKGMQSLEDTTNRRTVVTEGVLVDLYVVILEVHRFMCFIKLCVLNMRQG